MSLRDALALGGLIGGLIAIMAMVVSMASGTCS